MIIRFLLDKYKGSPGTYSVVLRQILPLTTQIGSPHCNPCLMLRLTHMFVNIFGPIGQRICDNLLFTWSCERGPHQWQPWAAGAGRPCYPGQIPAPGRPIDFLGVKQPLPITLTVRPADSPVEPGCFHGNSHFARQFRCFTLKFFKR